MFKRKKRQVPSLNTTSTADISFMLLILFLVTSSMDIDKGHVRQLPPIRPDEELLDMTNIDEHNVLRLQVMANGQLKCNDEPLPMNRLQQRVMTFVGQEADIQKHVIQLDISRDARYEVYFQIQNEIVGAYHTLRNQLARKKYGHALPLCTPEQQQTIRTLIPQRMAEVGAQQKGGAS